MSTVTGDASAALLERARARAASVPDPEIPVVTLDDLGILRAVDLVDGRVVVSLTPTYTGCPATEVIADDVRRALADDGIDGAEVRMVLSPPWTTDWISDDGRRKLREYGIAPPGACAGGGTTAVIRLVPRAAPPRAGGPAPADGAVPAGDASAAERARHVSARFLAAAAEVPAALAVETIECPRCGSADVERLSEHGSTPCKALYRCLACREPFDYFKPY